MLMRTDPFRDLDRLAEQVVGTAARPAAMPLDAYRDGDKFIVQFDLPGVSTESIDLTVERNVLTVVSQFAVRHVIDDPVVHARPVRVGGQEVTSGRGAVHATGKRKCPTGRASREPWSAAL